MEHTKLKEYLAYATAICITFFLYFQIVNHDFINLDDYLYIIENPNVNSGLSWTNITWGFTEFYAGNWHPMTWISHMMDIEIYGLNPSGHHLTNLIIHITNTALLLFFLHRTTGLLWPSAFVAILFSVHPTHVESVAWASERKDVLSTLFFLLTLISYHFYILKPNFKNYLTVLALLSMGLMSKAMLVTLPFVMLLLDYWPFRRFSVTNKSTYKNTIYLLKEKIPFFLLVLVVSIITYNAQKSGGAIANNVIFDYSTRINNALVAYVEYIKLSLLPSNLSIFHPHPIERENYKIFSSIFIILSITLTVVLNTKNRPYLIVGWLFFLGTLVPVIGIIQIGSQSIAERYTYIPYIGLFLMLTWFSYELLNRFAVVKKIIPILAISLIVSLSFQTWVYLSYWKNDLKLLSNVLWLYDTGYSQVIKKQNRSPDNRKVIKSLGGIYNLLGVSLMEKGMYDDAELHLKESVKIAPNAYLGYHNLGLLYSRKNDFEKAITYLHKANELSDNRNLNILHELNYAKERIKQESN